MSNCSETLIVGGGVIGLSVPRELNKHGHRVTVLERGSCCEEASWAAAGMLGPQAEMDARDDFYDLCAESRDLYPPFAAELLDETGVDVELDRTGTICISFDDDQLRGLQERYEWQKTTGLSVELLSADEVRRREPSISQTVRQGIYFDGDWQVENRKLCTALKKYADLNGIRILEGTEVTRIVTENGFATGAETRTGAFPCDNIVLAAGAWTSLIGTADTLNAIPHISPVRGQMIAFRPADRVFRHVIHAGPGYLVPRRDGRVLVGSTSEHVGYQKATTSDAVDKLHRLAVEVAPDLALFDIVDTWSGLRPFAADGLPVLGRVGATRNLFIATGHFRNGILLAPLTAKLIAEGLKGHDPIEFQRFGPDRFTTSAAKMAN